MFHIITTRLQTVDEIISRIARGVLSFPLVRHTWGVISRYIILLILFFSMVSDIYLDILRILIMKANEMHYFSNLMYSTCFGQLHRYRG